MSGRTAPAASPDPPNSMSPARRAARPPRLALHWQILIGVLVGAIAGIVANALYPPDAAGKPNAGLEWTVRNVAEPVGRVFLNLIFMVVLPLVFSALVVGVAGIGDVKRLGRVGLATLLFTVVFSGVSVVIGVSLTNAVRPGAQLAPEHRTMLRERYGADAARLAAEAQQSKSVRDALLDIIPKNPLRELVGAVDGSSPGGGLLAVMFFALSLGTALLFAAQRAAPFIAVLEGLFDACLVIIGFAMRLAPLGVAGLMFALTAVLGLDILRVLAWFIVTTLAGLLLHMLGVYSLVIGLAARTNPLRFFGRISEAILTAFATSSSNATLPTSLRVARDNLKLRPEVGNFVLTVGATANQNGTALYEGVTVLFLAQVFGVDLTLTQQITVAFTCVLAGIGTAGVPSGSIPFIALILQSVGVPAEGIGIILGVDRLLDMCRTTVNVAGDIAIAACVDRFENARAAVPDG